MKSYSPAIEALEARIAPAAVFLDATTLSVSLGGGVLKVIPKVKNASIDVTIEQLPNGDLLISDADGDDDLEDTADLTGGIGTINITSGNGDDNVRVALHGDDPLRAGIAITTGTGDDFITVSEGVLRGPLTITAKSAAGVVIGDLGAELDVRGAVKVTQIGGYVSLGDQAIAGAFKATGADDFELLGSVLGAATLKALPGGANFALGTTPGESAASIGGKLTITGSIGDDIVDVAHILVRGAASFGLGGGNNILTASASSVFHGATKVIGGAGDDSVTFGSAADAGPQFGGRVGVNLGAAAIANQLTTHSGLYEAGLAYSGGTGADHVAIGTGTQIYSDLVISAGNGANTVDVGTFSNLVKFTYIGGVDVDTLTLAGQGQGYVAGSVNLGAGDDFLIVAPTAGAFFTTFKADGGIGSDTATVPAAVLADGFVKLHFEV